MNYAVLAPATVEYPSSDGRPMAETPVHYACMVYVTEALKHRYREQPDVYVGANMLHYYEQGNPQASVSPDVFVVLGARKDEHREGGWRDTYRLWEEPKAPDFVLEITSRSTRKEDLGKKRNLYATLGVSEYVLHDPRAEYLSPPLQGFRLGRGAYEPLPVTGVENAVGVPSDVLGLHLYLRDGELRLRDPATGRDLLTYEQAMRASEQATRASERALLKYEEASTARRAAEAEIAELKRQLLDLQSPPAGPEE